VTLSSGDFGPKNCTPQTNARNITITNYSNNALTYTAALVAAAASGFTIVNPGPGTVAATGDPNMPKTANIVVQPKPYGTNLSVITDTLNVDITGIAAPEGGLRAVPLRVDVRGAIVTANPMSLTGFASNGTNTDTKNFAVTNSGNETIYLSWNFVRTVGGPAWTYNPPGALGPGTTRNAGIGFKASTNGDNQANISAVRTTNWFGEGTVACSPLPTVTLQGTGAIP
jgi:hypothetical protein